MRKLVKTVADRYINGGFPLLLMGLMWLGLWLFVWFAAYMSDPRWGHNYAESTAFLAVGLAYFNRRFLSDILACLAAALIIPTALELLPVNVTAITSAALTFLILVDILVERKRADDLFQPGAVTTAALFKKYLPCLCYLMLGSLALIYFLIRVPLGTYEKDLDTVVFDALLLPYVVLLIVEKLGGERRTWPKLLAFFFGMLILIAMLVLMADEPETWPLLAIVVLVTLLGMTGLYVARRTPLNN